MPFNPSFLASMLGRGNPAAPQPQPLPMAATLGTQLRGMFGGQVRDLAQAPDRSGGIGQQVRALTPGQLPVLKPAAPRAVPMPGGFKPANTRAVPRPGRPIY